LIVGRQGDAKQFAVGGPDRGGEGHLGGEGLVGKETNAEESEGEEGEDKRGDTENSP
jgi:hypothetical protein